MKADAPSLSESWTAFSKYVHQQFDIEEGSMDELMLMPGGELLRVLPGRGNKYALYFEDKQELIAMLARFNLKLSDGPDEHGYLEVSRP